MTRAGAAHGAVAETAGNALTSNRSVVTVLAERLVYVGSTAVAFYVAAAAVDLGLFGRFTAVLALVQLCVSFGGAGLDGVLVHELSRSNGDPALVATARSIRAVGFGMGAVVALIAAVLIGWSQGVVIAVGLLAVAQIGQANFAYDAALQADERFGRLSTNRLVGNLTANGLLVAVAITSPTILLLVATRAVEPLLTGLMHRLSYSGRAPRPRLGATARTLLARSWPVAIAALLMVTFMRVDAIMLSVLRTDRDVAVYSLAARASESFNFVSVALLTVFFARLIRVAPGALETARAQFLRRMLLAGVAVVPAALFVGWLTPFVTGDDYSEVPAIAAILTASLPGFFLFVALSRLAISMEREHGSLVVAAGTAVVNIVANLVLIPRYGISGAAVSTVLASVAGPIVCAVVIPELRGPIVGVLRTSPDRAGAREG